MFLTWITSIDGQDKEDYFNNGDHKRETYETYTTAFADGHFKLPD